MDQQPNLPWAHFIAIYPVPGALVVPQRNRGGGRQRLGDGEEAKPASSDGEGSAQATVLASASVKLSNSFKGLKKPWFIWLQGFVRRTEKAQRKILEAFSSADL
ncbi:hypothetical protein KSP40_PGU016274 [Platanthera guangdongensis]|uniref:Uncharacterized protein n=1 Tax=Platanthera guangdongensis TaxID=2320717 RepID=A0ABR2M150_9ASPA